MEYDDGKLLGGESSFKACDTGEEKYCVNDGSEIGFTNMECTD